MKTKVGVSGLSAACCLVLAACGGGGGSGSDSGETVTAQQDANLNGIYRGQFIEEGQSFDIVGLIQDNEVRMFSRSAATLYTGNLEANRTEVSGNTTVYEDGGGEEGTASLEGIIAERETLEGSFSTSYDTEGTFSLDYDDLYERDSSLSITSGTWSQTDGSYVLTLTFQNNGSFTGSDTEGCNYSGNINIIDSDFNIYDVDLLTETCGIENGDYEGFVVANDTVTQNDTLTYAVDNENFILFGDLIRQ